MKKLLGLLVFIAILALGWVYFFVPSSVISSADIVMHAPTGRVSDLIAQQKQWARWWPTAPTPAGYTFNGNRYSVAISEGNVIQTETADKYATVSTGRMLLALKTMDSTAIEWTIENKLSSNPFKKLVQYYGSNTLDKDLQSILNSLKDFAQRQDNIYGMFIEHGHVTDTVLVATRKTFDHYPTTSEIYTMVDKLKAYIKAENASETNSPMFNAQNNGTSYDVMVGIPTSRLLAGKGDIELKRMVKGNIVWGQVKGGMHTVEEAFRQLENYKYDYRLTSPAIPFALLITDRTKEQDSTKWVTKVFAPVL